MKAIGDTDLYVDEPDPENDEIMCIRTGHDEYKNDESFLYRKDGIALIKAVARFFNIECQIREDMNDES